MSVDARSADGHRPEAWPVRRCLVCGQPWPCSELEEATLEFEMATVESEECSYDRETAGLLIAVTLLFVTATALVAESVMKALVG